MRQSPSTLRGAPQRQAEGRRHHPRPRRGSLDGAVELPQGGTEAPRHQSQGERDAGAAGPEAGKEVGGLEGAGAADAAGGDGR